jgi:citrate synthase
MEVLMSVIKRFLSIVFISLLFTSFTYSDGITKRAGGGAVLLYQGYKLEKKVLSDLTKYVEELVNTDIVEQEQTSKQKEQTKSLLNSLPFETDSLKKQFAKNTKPIQDRREASILRKTAAVLVITHRQNSIYI